MRKVLFTSLAAIVLCAISTIADARCGVERWSVKTGTDADAHLVDLTLHHLTSVETMRSWPKPNQIFDGKRIAPHELEVWRVDAILTDNKIENKPDTGDSEYHLVLKGKSGDTMIAEIPSPTCVDSNSPFHAAIERARAQFDAKLHAEVHAQDPEIPVRVVGVGFSIFFIIKRVSRPAGSSYTPCSISSSILVAQALIEGAGEYRILKPSGPH